MCDTCATHAKKGAETTKKAAPKKETDTKKK